MDFVDPAKMHRHRILLFVGYMLVSVAIVIAALVLLYQAGGYGIAKNGSVIQNGILFLSSQPRGSAIYLNGELNTNKTNARLVIPSNVYNVELRRPGYNSWQRKIDLEGSTVEHFDYPILYPTQLTSSTLDTVAGTPSIAAQSPDRRWVVTSHPDNISVFSVYDLKNPTKTPTTITLPDNLLTEGTNQTWVYLEWADDNTHLVLEHHYDDKLEYILVDRQNPGASLNLSKTLSASPTQLTLNNRKYDQYYLYDAATQVLQQASLRNTTPTTTLDHVLAYHSYSDTTVLYVTDTGASAGKVSVKLRIGTTIYTIRELPVSSSYIVDLAGYNGALYVVCGADTDQRVYIYHDPVGQIQAHTTRTPVPIQVLHIEQPNYLKFSDNAQFVMAENGTHVAVYDLENKRGYNYVMTQPLDAPQVHVTWMDGDRLTYVTSGKQFVFDYDYTNSRELATALPQYLPAFSPDYTYLYTFAHAPVSEERTSLLQTSLLAPKDR